MIVDVHINGPDMSVVADMAMRAALFAVAEQALGDCNFIASKTQMPLSDHLSYIPTRTLQSWCGICHTLSISIICQTHTLMSIQTPRPTGARLLKTITGSSGISLSETH